jgi:RecB family exonuclease
MNRSTGQQALPDQQALPGMPQRLYACTPSRLAAWVDCPRRYRFSYLDRPPPPKGPPWAHNSLGAAVHAALAAWWRLPVEERSVPRAGRLLESGWLTDGFRDEAQSVAWREQSRAWVESYVARLDPADEPLGVERTVATRTDVLAVSGRLDRLDSRPGPQGEELVVVDYKTGRHLPSPEDARGSMALAVYATAAARVLRRPCRRVELHHLPTGRSVAHEHTDESVARHLRRAASIAAEASRADAAFRGGLDGASVDEMFPPRPGPRCGWCDFSRHCVDGRAAASVRAPWEGLGELGSASTA